MLMLSERILSNLHSSNIIFNSIMVIILVKLDQTSVSCGVSLSVVVSSNQCKNSDLMFRSKIFLFIVTQVKMTYNFSGRCGWSF